MAITLRTLEAAEMLGIQPHRGGKKMGTETALKELRAAGLTPCNTKEEGHRYHAKWLLTDVQKAAIDLEAARREAAQRAEERRREEGEKAAAKAEATKRTNGPRHSQVEDFVRVMANNYEAMTKMLDRMAEVERKMDELYRLWTE